MGKIAHSALSTRVLKALGLFGSLQAVSMLCAVVRTKLTAIWIGTAGVGVLSLFTSTLDLLKYFSTLSLNQTAVPRIAAASDEARATECSLADRVGVVFGTIGSLIALLLSPLLSRFTFGSYEYTWGFALLSPTVLLAVMGNTRMAILQGTDRLRALAAASFRAAIAITVAVIPQFYFFRMAAIVPVLVAYPLLTLLFLLWPQLNLKAIPWRSKELHGAVKRYARLGAGITIGVAIGMTADYLLRVFVGKAGSIEDVGLFQAGITIVKNYVGVIFAAISIEFFPRISPYVRRPRIASTLAAHEIALCLWILIPIISVFYAADTLIVRILYSESFLGVVPFLGIAIVSAIFRAFSWCWAIVIIARANSRLYIITETISAVTLLVFSIIGWHFWGLAGLGAAMVVQFIAYSAATYAICHRHFGLRCPAGVWRLLAFAVAMAAASFALRLIAWWAPLILAAILTPLSIKRLRA